MQTVSCILWDLGPWPGFEPRLPALGVWSPNHWTTREVPLNAIFYGDLQLGFPGGANGKEPTCQCRRLKRRGFHPNPWVGKIPWRREWQPAPVFLPGQFQGQRSLAGCSPWGGTESNTTEVTWHTWGLESIHIGQGVRDSPLGGGCVVWGPTTQIQ